MGMWGTVALGKKREVMDAYLVLRRSKEEISMLREEASNIQAFYQEQVNVISQQLKALSSKTDPFIEEPRSFYALCLTEHLTLWIAVDTQKS